jgi:competence protein ComEC
MSRTRIWLFFISLLLILAAVALVVRFYLYPLVADRLPWPEKPDVPVTDPGDDPDDPSLLIESTYQVHFIDVGQGDAILIQTPHKNVLIDGGDHNAGVSNYLRHLLIDTLHIVISTHPHADHIGGLPDALRSFPVLEIIDPGVVHTTRLFTTYLELIDSLDIAFTAGRAGMQRLLAEDVILEIVHPVHPSEKHLNDASVVTRLVIKDMAFFFSGDMEKRSEAELLIAGTPIQSQILKVAHHGSTTSSSEPFLDAVNPEVAIIFCGESNKYKFPHAETMHKLHMRNIAVYRTDQHGSVVVHTDGVEYYLETEIGGVNAAPNTGGFSQARINLNTADINELIRIMHIGPARARQLIDMRPIRSLDDLTRIQGIDHSRLEDIRKQNLAFI